MPYALLDDQYHSNPKVIAMGLDGAGLYSRALSYCADYLTDGFVPLEWATAIVGRRRKILAHLTEVGAWQRVHVRDRIAYTDRSGNEHELAVKDEGFWIADYVMFNPSRIEYQATRKKKASAGKKGAVTRWGDSTSDSTTHDSRNGTSHHETATDDVDNTGETMAPAMAPATPHARAPARTPSPTPELTTAAAGTTPDAAADLIDQLDDLGLNGAARELALADIPRAQAWITLAKTEAKTNPGGFVNAGLKSRSWPSTRGATAKTVGPAPCSYCGVGGGNHADWCEAASSSGPVSGAPVKKGDS